MSLDKSDLSLPLDCTLSLYEHFSSTMQFSASFPELLSLSGHRVPEGKNSVLISGKIILSSDACIIDSLLLGGRSLSFVSQYCIVFLSLISAVFVSSEFSMDGSSIVFDIF